ncbi:MAG: glycosyltransferase family 2 protein [Patescibacteria group bacterium]|nr:glycosyltransferase family 2 protein [Patescibacteria group bacterium]
MDASPHIVSKPLPLRLLEIAPGILTWATFIAAVVFSYISPFWVAFFIILFDLYWFLKAVNISFHLAHTYRKIQLHERIDWLDRCEGLLKPTSLLEKFEVQAFAAEDAGVREDLEQAQAVLKRFLGKHSAGVDFRKLVHLIILPTIHESWEVLRASIDSYLACDYPKDRMILVLACEERAGEPGLALARTVEKYYGGKFMKFLATFHPEGLPGEARTKGANITYAARQARIFIDQLHLPHADVIVSAFDADTVVKPNYFSQLSYTYLTVECPTRASYQPVPLYNNNIWDAPAINRLVAVNSSFWQMVESSRSDRLVTFSSHSMSFAALTEVDYWPTDVVSEDSQIFWRCFLHYRGNYQTVPLFTTVSLDAVSLGSYWNSLVGQYKQNRRWAWGIVDFPYVAYGFARDRTIPFWKKILFAYRLLEGHYFWATAAPIIAFLGWLPLLLGGGRFENQVFATNLPEVTGTIMTISTFLLIFFVVLYFGLLPKRPDGKKRFQFLVMILQWLLVPVSSLCFGAIPAIDAQTRLMLGKYMEFWPTPKIRREAEGRANLDSRPAPSSKL